MITLITEERASQPRSISRVIFMIDRKSGKIISVAPVVDSDEELAQIELFIEACIILSDLIRPAKDIDQKAA